MRPSPPITEEAGTASVAVEAALPGVSLTAPMTSSTTFCTSREMVPVGAAPEELPRTVTVKCTVSFKPALGGSAATVVVLAVPASH